MFRIAWRGDTPPVLVSIDVENGKAAPGTAARRPSRGWAVCRVPEQRGRWARRGRYRLGSPGLRPRRHRQAHGVADPGRWRRPVGRRGGCPVDLPRTAGWWRSRARPPTSPRAMPTASRMSSSATGRRVRRASCRSISMGRRAPVRAASHRSRRTGEIVVFASLSDDLVAQASGGVVLAVVVAGRSEVYARDVGSGETIRISEARAGGPGGAAERRPGGEPQRPLRGLGIDLPDLTDDPDNRLADVFVRDLPPVAALAPPVLDFGRRAVSVAAVPATATMSDVGWSPLAVTRVSITGPAAPDFATVADGCTATTLRRGQSCTVTVGFTPGGSGNRLARLEIAHGAERLAGHGPAARQRLAGIADARPAHGRPRRRHHRRWAVGSRPARSSTSPGSADPAGSTTSRRTPAAASGSRC